MTTGHNVWVRGGEQIVALIYRVDDYTSILTLLCQVFWLKWPSAWFFRSRECEKSYRLTNDEWKA